MGKSESFDRQTVMDQVTNMFWTKGYNGTSMQDIVDATGLNRSSIYNSFGDKQNLYHETLKHYKQKYQSGVFTKSPDKTPKQILINIFESILREIEDKTNTKGCYLANCTAELSNQDLPTLEFLTANMKELVELFEQIVEQGIVTGDFRSDIDSKQTALYLFSSLQGLKITGMLVQSKHQMSSIISQIFSNM